MATLASAARAGAAPATATAAPTIATAAAAIATAEAAVATARAAIVTPRWSAWRPLLTADEEIELAKRIERGDLEAKEKMINSNLRLVVSQARRYQGHGFGWPRGGKAGFC
jgi:RNA polymerase primary sigma factor